VALAYISDATHLIRQARHIAFPTSLSSNDKPICKSEAKYGHTVGLSTGSPPAPTPASPITSMSQITPAPPMASVAAHPEAHAQTHAVPLVPIDNIYRRGSRLTVGTYYAAFPPRRTSNAGLMEAVVSAFCVIGFMSSCNCICCRKCCDCCHDPEDATRRLMQRSPKPIIIVESSPETI